MKFALRERTRLAALRVRDDVLVLQTLLWADEVREAAFPSLDDEARVTDKELAMSAQLVASFEADFTPEEYEDDYQAQLRQLIEAKLEQGDALDTAETFGEQPKESEGAEVIDLMEALRKSVASSKSSRASGGKASGSGSGSRSGSGSGVDREVRFRPRELVVGQGVERFPVDEREQELGHEGEGGVEAGREEEHEPRRLHEGEVDHLEDDPEEGVRLAPGGGRAPRDPGRVR